METRGTNVQAHDDKGLEKLMDEYLKANGLFRKKIAKDGSCLFRAVAEQVLHCQGQHTKVRTECVKYLRQERSLYESFIEGDFEEYLQRLQDPQSWVGQVEISALSVLYKRDFIIYQQPGEPPVNITENGYPDQVRLCFLNGNHYDSVYPLSYNTNAAICQSILYELLYERVFRVDRSLLNANTRGSKVRDEPTEVEEGRSSEESDLTDGDGFWSGEVTSRTVAVNKRGPYKGRGRGQIRGGGGRGNLSPKVQDSLNPTYFRNVEYDVWLRSKKAQQRRDFCLAAGMHYTAGSKCQVRVRNGGRYYSAYIQDVSPDEGPVTVFIEELGEKHTVPLWDLRPPSEESWCTVSDKGKRHSVSNGNAPTNEWEMKGGRKPVRSVSIPHASQATAGSTTSNRVQKQHSWPPQATAETRPLGKNVSGRKFDQGVGMLSHVEEEEHALLELLHKDENNFPTLEASAQAACSDGGRRVDRKGSRKKADAEMKEPSQRPSQKAERGTHGKKSSVDHEQRSYPSLRDKASPSPPSTPPSAASPAPAAPKATKPTPALPAAAPASAQTTTARSRTAPVPSTTATTSIQTAPAQPKSAPPVAKTTTSEQSQTALATAVTSTSTIISQNTPTQVHVVQRMNPVPTPPSTVTPNPSRSATLSHVSGTTALAVKPTASETTTVPSPSPPLSAPVTTTPPVSTATIPHAVSIPPSPATPGYNPDTTLSPPAPLSALTPCQNAPGSTSVPTHVPPQDPSAPVSAPPMVPTSGPSPLTVPVGTPAHTPDLPTASSTPPSVSVPANTPTVPTDNPPAPPFVQSAPAAQPPSSVAPFHPVELGAFPGMQPLYRPYPPPVPMSGAMPTPPPVMSSVQTPPFPHPPESTATLVTGVAPAAVPEYQALPVQHTFPLSHLLIRDPLYPGFPLSNKDEAVQAPAFSLNNFGKDLPKDVNVLRWFFNLGVKAYTHQMLAPFSYLAPLTQAYQMQLKGPPPASSMYTPSWLPDQNPPSLPLMSHAPNHTPMGPPGVGGGPIAHFEVRAVTSGPPPVEVAGYSAHHHSVAMPMPPRPAVPWSATHPPPVFPGAYPLSHPGSVPYSVPLPGAEAYPPTSVGHQRHPVPPPLHRRIDIATATVPSVMERGEGDGQRSLTPQTEKHTWSGGGQLHPGGIDIKPAPVSIAMPTTDPQHSGGAMPVVPAVLIGGAAGEGLQPAKLANGITKGGDITKSFHGGGSEEAVSAHTTPCSTVDDWEGEEVEYGDPDMRSGRLYYSQSYKSGGRRGQEDRRGFRGSFRGRRDYSGRSRPHNQSVYSRVYRGRGRGRGFIQHSNDREAGYTGGHFAPSPQT